MRCTSASEGAAGGQGEGVEAPDGWDEGSAGAWLDDTDPEAVAVGPDGRLQGAPESKRQVWVCQVCPAGVLCEDGRRGPCVDDSAESCSLTCRLS